MTKKSRSISLIHFKIRAEDFKFPEDAWFRLTTNKGVDIDLNIWIDDLTGEKCLDVYPISNGKTDCENSLGSFILKSRGEKT